jgi:PAS domain S-box-containing protein
MKFNKSLPDPLTGNYFLKEFVPRSEHASIREAFFRAMESDEKVHQDFIEFHVKSPLYKQKILVYASIRVVKESAEKIRAYGTIQDITEFRRAEEELEAYRRNLEQMVSQRTTELKNSERKLQDALNIAKLGTWEFNFNHKKFYVGSEVVEKMGTGYRLKKTSELSVEEFYQILHPEDQHIFSKASERALQSSDEEYKDSFECRIVTDDNVVKYLFISVRIQIGDNGKHTKHYGTIQDITNIRRIESEKERLTSIIEATSDIVAIGRISGELLYLNSAGQQLTGLKTEDVMAREYVSSLFDESSEEIIFTEALPKALKTGIWKGQTTLIDRDGNYIPVSQVILSHRDKDGRIDSYSTIMRDISELKQIEQDLIYKNNELDTFVYSAGHDLKGPIASLMGLNKLVIYEVSDPVALSYFDRYHKQILRMDSIVKTLLELARIKDAEIVYEPINFNTIIHNCLQSFENFEHYHRFNFEINIDEEIEFKSDPHLIRTILQNLIENSIKYARKEVDPWLKISLSKKGKTKIQLMVADNGIGIREEDQQKIFNMFYRAHEGGEGSGLGLYILKNAADKLNAKVFLNSQVNKGTIFNIEFTIHNQLV